MGRPIRVHVDGGIYHVILRGNAREPIFFDSSDRRQLNQIIAEGLDRYDCRLHAFCWMTNHIHAAIQVSDRALSEFMCWSASKYARFINRKRGRTGHLFERRYRAFLVRDDAYLLGLVKYIHLNPVRAGLVSSPGQYLWSSHRVYLGTQKIEWVTTRGVLSCFAGSAADARGYYRKFVDENQIWDPYENEDSTEDRINSLTSGELSMWSRSDRNDEDVGNSLGELVAEYCSMYDLNPAVLLGSGRQRDAAKARAMISHQAITSGMCTLKDLSLYFGRAPEVISRGIKRYCADLTNKQPK